MYTVTIFDKSQNIFKSYENIHTIKYFDIISDWLTVSGDEILSHNFPCSSSYQLIGDSCNYSVNKSAIGTIEIVKEC